MEEGSFGFSDCGKAKLVGAQKLMCRLTFRAGEVVYDLDGVSMPKWQDAPEDYWVLKDPEPK
jgi:dihydroorotase